MRFDGFISHVSLIAGILAATCLAVALLASSVVAAHRLEAVTSRVPIVHDGGMTRQ